MIVVDLIITVLAYMLIPFVNFYILKKKMVKRKIILFNFVNSFVVMMIFMAIRQYLGESNLYSGAPSFLYWGINNFIYTRYSLKSDDKVEHIENIIKNDIKNYNKENNNKIVKKPKINKNYKNVIIMLILLFLLIISASLNIYFKINLDKSNEEVILLNKAKAKNKYCSDFEQTKLDILFKKHDYYYVNNKLEFMDKNIVFVIDGYGNYYSDYDCMLQRVGNNNFKYWAYNKEYAQSRGYKEYICN